MPKTIDVHAHILTEDTMQMIAKEAPSLGLKLTPIDKDSRCSRSAACPTGRYPRGALGHRAAASRT